MVPLSLSGMIVALLLYRLGGEASLVVTSPTSPYSTTTDVYVYLDIFAFNTNNLNIMGGRFYGAIVVLKYIYNSDDACQ